MVEGNRKYGRPKRKLIYDIKERSKMTQSDLMVKRNGLTQIKWSGSFQT